MSQDVWLCGFHNRLPIQNSLFGVDFIKVGCMVQIIEIALSIYALHLHQTFEELFTGIKVQRKVQKIVVGHKTVYEIDPQRQK